MSFVAWASSIKPFNNLPQSLSQIRPEQYASEIEGGFRLGMGLIRERWSEIANLCDQFLKLSAGPRVIFRPTSVYAAALHALRDPRKLRSGIALSARLDFDRGDRETLEILGDEKLVAAERRALLNGDVPYFLAHEESGVTDLAGAIIEDAVNPIPAMHSLAPPQDAEIERDVRLIRWSLGGRRPPEPRPWGDREIDSVTARSIIAQEAVRVVNVILERAVVAGDGAAWWGRVPLLSAPSIAVLGPGLYDGVSGIGLFLEAAGRVLDIGPAREMALNAFRTVRALVARHRPSSAAPQRTIGLASGMSGIAYAAILASNLTLAREAARCVTEKAIAADRTYDLLNGSAGALIVFLNLWDITKETEWLEKALLCGDQLIEGNRRCTYWGSAQGISAGIAHGVAGIGMSLCRLARVADRSDFAQIGLDALKLSDEAYDPYHQDWADNLGDEANRHYWNRWCHGSIGIGLAWREQVGDVAKISADIVARAIAGSLRNPTRPFDNLCCGNFGHIDFALEMASGDSRKELEAVAMNRAVWLIHERSRTGYICDDTAEDATLGFFSGLSGVGYTLIRLLNPRQAPSVLSLLPVTRTASLP